MSTTLIIFAIILICAILRPITITLHELGHAIPALIFTQNQVNMYIGSYKDLVKSKKIKLGRLQIFFRYNPMQWTGGFCELSNMRLSKTQQIIILLSGPVFVFATFLALTLTAIIYHWSDIPKSLVMILLLSSIYDLFIDLVPNQKSVVYLNGNKVYNDGQAIINVIRTPKSKGIANSISSIDQDNLINQSFVFTRSAADKHELGDHIGAISDVSKAIDIYDQNPINYNNRGYYYQLLKEYEKSIPDLNKAIELNNNFAYAFNNRGFSNIMLGNIEEGLIDILESIKLDKNNSYAVRNLGIYYFKKGNYKKAQESLQKALDMDESTPLVQEYLAKLV